MGGGGGVIVVMLLWYPPWNFYFYFSVFILCVCVCEIDWNVKKRNCLEYTDFFVLTIDSGLWALEQNQASLCAWGHAAALFSAIIILSTVKLPWNTTQEEDKELLLIPSSLNLELPKEGYSPSQQSV